MEHPTAPKSIYSRGHCVGMGGLDRVASRKLDERVAKLEKRVTMLTLASRYKTGNTAQAWVKT